MPAHTSATALPLAAIRYEPGYPINDLLYAVRAMLLAEGIRVGGATQENTGPRDGCEQMTLVNIATGERTRISQNLGAQATGCRLDPAALTAFGSILDAAIGEGVDLLIVNKFGRAESEGHGLRGLFTRAVDAGIPVLTAVRAPYSEAWADFHEGYASDLPADLAAVAAWCRGHVKTRGKLLGSQA